ncbi:5437_t:CDS:2, partial [Ambispora leptoticha]
TKQKHTSILGITKREICQKLSKPNPSKQKDLAAEYYISTQAISNIWKERNKWLYLDNNNYDTQLKKLQAPGYPLIEKVMKRKLQYTFAQQLTLTDEILAKRFASNLGNQHEGGSAPSADKLNTERNSANEYLHLDDVLPIEDFPDDTVLIEQICNEDNNKEVQSDTNDNNYSSELLQVFFLQERSNFAKNLVKFLLQQDDDFGVSAKDLEVI